MVPFKKSGSHNFNQFQLLMGAGIFLSGLVFSLALGYPLKLNPYGLISGLLWAVANVISLSAVLNLGLSKAVPIMSSLVILSNFLWGALVFGELPSGVMMGFLAIALIILGVILVSSSGRAQGKNIKKGLLAASLAGLIFGSQLAPLKIGHLATGDFFFSVSLGIFATSLLIAAVKIKFKKEAIGESLLSGVIWNVGNLLSLMAVSFIGLSRGIPVSQSSTLVAVVWGLFYFKENSSYKDRLQILAGAIILLLGVFVLSLA